VHRPPPVLSDIGDDSPDGWPTIQAGWKMCSSTSSNPLDCLHKCMKNIPHKAACTITSSWWWT